MNTLIKPPCCNNGFECKEPVGAKHLAPTYNGYNTREECVETAISLWYTEADAQGSADSLSDKEILELAEERADAMMGMPIEERPGWLQEQTEAGFY